MRFDLPSPTSNSRVFYIGRSGHFSSNNHGQASALLCGSWCVGHCGLGGYTSFHWIKASQQAVVQLEPVLSIEYPAFAVSRSPSSNNDHGASAACAAIVVHANVLLASAHCQGLFLANGVDIHGDDVKSHHDVVAELLHPDYHHDDDARAARVHHDRGTSRHGSRLFVAKYW
jgi:hypothetical protein